MIRLVLAHITTLRMGALDIDFFSRARFRPGFVPRTRGMVFWTWVPFLTCETAGNFFLARARGKTRLKPVCSSETVPWTRVLFWSQRILDFPDNSKADLACVIVNACHAPVSLL